MVCAPVTATVLGDAAEPVAPPAVIVLAEICAARRNVILKKVKLRLTFGYCVLYATGRHPKR